MKVKTNFKKYALLENGTIEPLYYSNGELRRIEQERDGTYHLYHDVFYGNIIAYCDHKIIKEADTKEELLKDQLKLLK